MQKIDDITLIKPLGKGSFGEVYLSTKKGRSEYFATKKLERAKVDKPGLKKYFDNELKILESLNHPNIVKLEGIRKSPQHYYIIMEFINGGMLSDCLKKYMDKYNKAFTEEIVQHLMKQIINALYYIHSRKIIHRDLKLDNIMVHFDSEFDKQNLNMMKATIKIIDFGFAVQLNPQNKDLTYSAVGSPINMDPIILEKFSKKRGNINLGYDEKADIWSIGTVCYELLIGKSVFDAKTMNDLVEKVEKGQYNVPSTVSKEVVSFLNGMLQYDSKYRLSSAELLKHPFLTKNPANFKQMKTSKASKNENNDIKKNKSIWAIFNDEDKFINVEGGKNKPDTPVIEEEIKNKTNQSKTTDNLPNYPHSNNHSNDYYNPKNSPNQNQPYLRRNYTTTQSPFFGATSFYGQNMHANNPPPSIGMNQRSMPIMNAPQMPNMNIQQQPMMAYPTFGVGMPYSYQTGIYQNQNKQYMKSKYPSSKTLETQNNRNMNYNAMYKNTKYENDCLIQ